MTFSNIVNIVGLVASLFGVILLFRYGMPYRVRTKGETYLVLNGPLNQEEIKADRRFDRWGKLGLILIVLGTIAQIGALLL
jgi:hypothetical protein